jgi:hypothetical protein
MKVQIALGIASGQRDDTLRDFDSLGAINHQIMLKFRLLQPEIF